MSRLSADIDLLADGKGRTGLRARGPHFGAPLGLWLDPDPHRAHQETGDGPSVAPCKAGTHGDEWGKGPDRPRQTFWRRASNPRISRAGWSSCRRPISPRRHGPASAPPRSTEGNLNRLYPGRMPRAPSPQQIAYWIEHAPAAGPSTTASTFHSGGSSLTYIPRARWRRATKIRRCMQKIIGMLKAFGAPGCPYIAAAAPQGGGRHLHLGVGPPRAWFSMGTELGGGGLVTPASLKGRGRMACAACWPHIGLLQGSRPRRLPPTRLTEIGGRRLLRSYASDGRPVLSRWSISAPRSRPASRPPRIHFHHTPWARARSFDLPARRGLVACASACRARWRARPTALFHPGDGLSEDSKSCDGAGARGYPSFARRPHHGPTTISVPTAARITTKSPDAQVLVRSRD